MTPDLFQNNADAYKTSVKYAQKKRKAVVFIRLVQGKTFIAFKPENIKYYTYARLMNMTEDDISESMLDYIVLDKIHHCGAHMWGTGVETMIEGY